MNTKKLRYGIVGAIVALPFGLMAGGYMVDIGWWLALMGTKWVAYKSAVSSVLMAGFGLGIALCPSEKNEDANDLEKVSSIF